MKVLQLLGNFYPQASGGAEIYVEELAFQLQKLGVEVVVAAPFHETISYDHRGLKVRRYTKRNYYSTIDQMYQGIGDPEELEDFGVILEDEYPDIVHFHAYMNSGNYLAHYVHRVRQQLIPVLITYHSVNVTCIRGTLMKWGSEQCNGKLSNSQCTRCYLNSRGLNKTFSTLLSLVPRNAGNRIGDLGFKGGLPTALRMTSLIDSWHSSVQNMLNEANMLVTVCDWIKEVLLLNDVPESKIFVSRQAVSDFNLESPASAAPTFGKGEPLRLVFVGRLDPLKGIHKVIEALQRMPNALVKFDIYGIGWNDGDAYLKHLLRIAEGDKRIVFLPPVLHENIIPLLKGYHMLVLPSQCLEVAPLVVLEAFAAGIPVLGSNLGGIAEYVEHGKNGLLIEAASAEGWSKALDILLNENGLLETLRSGVTPPRRMADVAQEMLRLYQSL